MLKRLFLSAMLCAPVILAGCGIEAPRPRRTPARPAPPPPLSNLSASITIPAAQIARLLDNMTEYRIADLHDQPVKCGIGQCRLDLMATRTGSITVAAREDALEVRLPFTVKAALATSGLLRLGAQAEGRGIANAHVSLMVEPDLQLHANTSGAVELDNGQLRIGPLVTNIAQIWNENQESFTHPLWRSLDKQIAAVPLRSRLAAFWAEAFTPI